MAGDGGGFRIWGEPSKGHAGLSELRASGDVPTHPSRRTGRHGAYLARQTSQRGEPTGVLSPLKVITVRGSGACGPNTRPADQQGPQGWRSTSAPCIAPCTQPRRSPQALGCPPVPVGTSRGSSGTSRTSLLHCDFPISLHRVRRLIPTRPSLLLTQAAPHASCNPDHVRRSAC